MKKNGQYVGVDEKFIPEEEKYIKNDLNDEIKDDMKGIYKNAKEYVSDKNNQEKIKKTAKKGLKVIKGVGIGYVAFFGIITILIIASFVFVFIKFSKTNNQSELINSTTTNNNNESDAINEQQKKIDVTRFNLEIESYSGTKNGSTVTSLLDKVVTKIKTDSNHPITIIYNSTETSNTDEITLLKKQFDANTKYEVSMDYDSNGFINKITIINY